MKKQKILLFGGSGFLGSKLATYLKPNIVISPTHTDLDLLKIENVYQKIENTQPDIIIYAAGITKIDVAESDKEITFKLNAKIPEKIAEYAAKNNIHVMFISTDAVFDGYKNKYLFSEMDNPNAKSTYGLSKLQGEYAILSKNTDNSIIRLITLFGIDNKRQNFVARVLNDLNNNKTVFGITDQVQNPLYVDIATQAVSFLTNQNSSGIYHLGALNYDTNYHFLIKLADKYKLDRALVKKITYKEFFKEKSANRKKMSVLLCDKFIALSQNKILKSIDDSLNYLFELNKNFLSK